MRAGGLRRAQAGRPAGAATSSTPISSRARRRPGCRTARSGSCPSPPRRLSPCCRCRTIAQPPPRLAAMTWGAEDLSAALGAATNRDEDGEFLFTYKIVRSLVPDRGEGGGRATASRRCTPISATRRPRTRRARGPARGLHRHARDPSGSGRDDQRRLHAVRRRRRACQAASSLRSRAAPVSPRSTARCSTSRISSRRSMCWRWPTRSSSEAIARQCARRAP